MAELVTVGNSFKLTGPAMYSAFISYSHTADRNIAPALQTALHRFARPWNRLHAVRIFRDQTNLSLNPELWPSIQEALRNSEYFLLLASPQAALSKWVQREVGYWLTKDANASKRLFIILTDGELIWDEAFSDFDWTQTTSLPSALCNTFSEEPLYLDLRWARKDEDLSLRNPIFKEAIANIAAPLHGVSKDTLIGEDVRQYKKSRRLMWAAIISLLVLSLAAGVAASVAIIQSRVAMRERDAALSREMAMSALSQLATDPELSLILAVEAARISSTTQAEDALRQSLVESRVRATMRGDGLVVHDAEFSPDGRFVLTTASDKTARLWEAGTGQATAVMRGHTDRLADACFSGDGRSIATTSVDGTTRVWDASTGNSIAVLSNQGKEPTRLQFSSDGRVLILSYSDRSSTAWEVGSWRTAASENPPGIDPSGDVFSPDQKFKVTGMFTDSTRVLDAASGETIFEIRGHTGDVSAVAFSPDRKLLITAAHMDVTARVWEVATGGLVANLLGHQAPVEDVAFGPDSRTIVTAGSDGTAKVWDLDIWQNISALAEQSMSIHDSSFSHDTKFAGSLTDAHVSVLDTTTGQRVLLCESQVGDPPEFSRDGRFIVANCNSTARVFEVGTWRPITEVRAPDGIFNSVNFSPNSKLMVTAGRDGIARVWEVTTGQKVAELKGHTDRELYDATFSPDNNFIVTACADSNAMVWEASTGTRLAVLRGHTGPVRSASYSHDGKWIATVSDDRTVRLWVSSGGREAVILRGNIGDYRTITFSSDGKYLISKGENGAQAYDCEVCGSVESLITIARKRITRQLTNEERQIYLH